MNRRSLTGRMRPTCCVILLAAIPPPGYSAGASFAGEHASRVVAQAGQSRGVLVAPVPPGGDPLSVVGLGSEITVLVVVEPDCARCRDSIPFYKRLIALPRMDGKVRRLVVIGRKGVIPVQDMLQAASFKPHRLTSGPREPVAAIKEVPTIILLDANGKRMSMWTGVLTQQQEEQVVSAIRATSGTYRTQTR